MINAEKMSPEQLSLKIKRVLERPTVLRTMDICLDDITRTIVPGQQSHFIEVVRILSQLQGRTVERVVFDNTPTHDFNPMGDIGHFEIHLKP